MSLRGRNFLNTSDFSLDEIHNLVDLALRLKSGAVQRQLPGKLLAMLFFNPSLRTRASFTAAMYRLGGMAVDLPLGQGGWPLEFEAGGVMDGAAAEHVREAASVIGRYCNALAVRSSELVVAGGASGQTGSWADSKQDRVVQSFARWAGVPVVNMESNVYHPCQGLGDAVTLKEKLGRPQGKKYVLTWAYHPKALPMATPNSQLAGACDLGMDVVVAHPPGWELDPEIMAAARARAQAAGGSLTFSHDMPEAAEGAQVICAKSWGALKYYSDWETEKLVRRELKHWKVDEALMRKTANGLFMHCLPVRRNVVVSDAVLDGPWSIVVDQAENRMWAQMAVLAEILAE
jgi:N-acetylornithine carbamoyltransferase